MPASVSFTPSEKESSTSEFKGTIRNTSIAGLCIVVPNLPRSLFTILDGSRGQVLVSAKLPGNEALSQITGTILRLDFYSKAPEPFCRFGLLTDRSSEKTNRDMENAVNFLQSRSVDASQLVYSPRLRLFLA